MRLVRSQPTTGIQNLWDMRPVLEQLIAYGTKIIADPDILCGSNLSFETASMDGKLWKRPEAMYAAHALLPTLSMNKVQAILVELLEGMLEAWRRFGSDILGRRLTDAQKEKVAMPTTNDVNEGFLGANGPVAKRKAPNATLEQINLKAQFKQNGTAELIEQKLNTREGHQFLRQQAQAISSQGREKKRKTVTEHHAAKAKSDAKREAEIAAINKCIPIFDIACFEDPVMLKKILLPQIDLQLKWHRLRELETNKKTEIPALSKMSKKQKPEILMATIRRWITQVNAGQVHLMGPQLSQPVLSEEGRRVRR
ncbi:hypothetical protein GGX14DRAFT_571839 [Mycena pura]|uniref:Uncharacterized protein n=1 Tax=Mycena pura TaxID=153505 RepID=A0AAD6Y7L2_9AGAR|nr:hypothetical protein GGX14DRAFT_571839 [Mycena pura]